MAEATTTRVAKPRANTHPCFNERLTLAVLDSALFYSCLVSRRQLPEKLIRQTFTGNRNQK